MVDLFERSKSTWPMEHIYIKEEPCDPLNKLKTTPTVPPPIQGRSIKDGPDSSSQNQSCGDSILCNASPKIKEEDFEESEVLVKEEPDLSHQLISIIPTHLNENMTIGGRRINAVKYLQKIEFSQLTLNEKMEIKTRGRHTPILSIQQSSMSRSKEYTRQFNISVYQKCEWLCGCEEKNALFCFPCLLLGGDSSWTKIGVDNLRILSKKIEKHEQSSKHMNNIIDLSLLGKVNIAAQIGIGYKLSVANHNERVKKNRDTLSKVINCIKFCRQFELPPREHDHTISSNTNPDVIQGLVDFACEFDFSLQAHINNAAVFKGTFKSIQNELLESMLEICKDKIKEEVMSAEYLAVMCDQVTDINGQIQLVIVLRYELQGKPVERFWGFFNLTNRTAEALSSVLCEELQILIHDCPHKLIAQTYDGMADISGVKGVQFIIKEVYPNAHFIHSYAHQLHLILEEATSKNIVDIRVFFNSLSGIPEFFSNSPQRIATLESVAADHKIQRLSTVQMYLTSRTVNAVNEMKNALIDCCSELETSNSRETGSVAAGIKRILIDSEFEFWLKFFSRVIPHIDIMFSQLQSRYIDAAKANACLEDFVSAVQKLRDDVSNFITSHPEQKRRKIETDRSFVANKVCDVILLQCRERFSFNKHLEVSKLLLVNKFHAFTKDFPSSALAQAVEAYPMLDKDKLRSELTVLYTRKYICNSEKLLDMLFIMNNNNLQSIFSETVKLLKILLTIPMITAEADRCFSTLKRIETFFRGAMMNEKLSALGMISIENILITEISDFNELVINNFAATKSHGVDFIFK